MRLAALTLVLAAFVVAAPAWAQSPPPTVVTFESQPYRGDVYGATGLPAGARAGGRTRRRPVPAGAVREPAGPDPLRGAAEPRRAVRAGAARRRRPVRHRLRAAAVRRGRDRAADADARAVRLDAGRDRRPDGRRDRARRLRQRPGRGLAATAGRRRRRVVLADLRPTRHAIIRSGRRSGSATNHPLGGSFVCELDGAALAPCTSPFSPAGLPPGQHVLTAAAIDVYGRIDPSRQRRRVHRPAAVSLRRPTATRTGCPTRATTAPPTPTPTSPTATRTEWGTPASSCRPATRRRRPA